MMADDKVFIVDAGNTRVKVALFIGGKISLLKRLEKTQNEDFENLLEAHDHPPIFVSSVLSDYDLSYFLGSRSKAILFNLNMKLPISISYTSPETLGLDRLANACAIQSKRIEGNKVAIDLGTCIKFDFVDSSGVYHGGSISPGLHMRFEALHHFTGKLPLLAPMEDPNYLGVDSESAMQAGVIEGIQGELNYFISRYLQDYQGLTFFVTGGNAKFFDFGAKNNIFADENLTLTGLYEIYMLNA